ncbi:MAG: hypothetical protein ACRED4_08205, partial [Brevundimonas sp.]
MTALVPWGVDVVSASNGHRATEMNRRQLGLGAALTAVASAAGVSAHAQTRDPAAVAFYNGFNDQLARLPEAIQG